jgi:hypothetical protein
MRVEQRLFLAVSLAILIPACGGGGASEGTPAATGTAEPDPAREDPRTSLGGSQPPNVRIVTPGPASTCHEGATVTIKAVAIDPDTEIVRVEFFDGGKHLGSRVAEPFALAWGGVKAGAHVLTAVAFDVQGLSASSDPVTVFVIARGSEDVEQVEERDERRGRRR